MTWNSMMSMCKIRGRRSSCSSLEWGEAIRDYLLLTSGYGTWNRIGLISMGRRRIAGSKVSIGGPIRL